MDNKNIDLMVNLISDLTSTIGLLATEVDFIERGLCMSTRKEYKPTPPLNGISRQLQSINDKLVNLRKQLKGE